MGPSVFAGPGSSLAGPVWVGSTAIDYPQPARRQSRHQPR